MHLKKILAEIPLRGFGMIIVVPRERQKHPVLRIGLLFYVGKKIS